MNKIMLVVEEVAIITIDKTTTKTIGTSRKVTLKE